MYSLWTPWNTRLHTCKGLIYYFEWHVLCWYRRWGHSLCNKWNWLLIHIDLVQSYQKTSTKFRYFITLRIFDLLNRSDHRCQNKADDGALGFVIFFLQKAKAFIGRNAIIIIFNNEISCRVVPGKGTALDCIVLSWIDILRAYQRANKKREVLS